MPIVDVVFLQKVYNSGNFLSLKMVAHSTMRNVREKLYVGKKCHEVFHPFTTHCSIAVLDMFWAGLRGSYKYFLIMYVLQLLLKGRKADRAYVKSHIIGFCRSAMVGSAAAGVFLVASCSIRAVLGRYYHYTAVALPGGFAGLVIFLERPVRRGVYSYAFSQASLEYLVRYLESSGIGPLSKGNETLVFMGVNAVLLYLLKTHNGKDVIYWFFTPPSSAKQKFEDAAPLPNKVEQPVCPHQHTCKHYIAKSILQYAGAGVGIQLLRLTFAKLKHLTRAPTKTLKHIVWNKDTFKLGAFLGAYIGIYKAVSCWLCRHYGGDSDLYALPAGLLAGSAYYLNPERAFGMSAITSLLQVSVSRGKSSKVIPDLPYTTEMAFIFSCAVMFHAFFVDNDNCPRFISTTVNTVTSGRADFIYKNFMKICDGYAKKMSLEG